MKIVVTGGSGYVASRLRQLLGSDSIVALDHASWDITTERFPKISGADAVVHLAYRSQGGFAELMETNCVGTRNVLEFARLNKIGRMVYLSTTHVYNFSEKSGLESKRERPSDYYGLSKLMGEQVCDLYRNNSEVSSTALRSSTIYGYAPRTKRKGINRMVMDAIERGRIEVETNITFPFIHVDDVCEYIVQAAQSPIEGAYNISCEYMNILDIAAQVKKEVGRILGTEVKIRKAEDLKITRRPNPSTRKVERALGLRPSKRLHEALGELIGRLRPGKAVTVGSSG